LGRVSAKQPGRASAEHSDMMAKIPSAAPDAA
jgi:hypothetical protein